jgi:hypothetical protein
MDITFDIQDPKCDPEQLLEAFKRWRAREARVGLRSIRNTFYYFRKCDMQRWLVYVVKNLDVVDYPETLKQLMTIWLEAKLIIPIYDDEKFEERQLYAFTKE